MTPVGQRAGIDPIAVGEKHRTGVAIGTNGDGVARQHIGPIRKIGDPPEPLGFALRAEHVRRDVEPFERGVRRGRDPRANEQLTRFRRRVEDQ